MSAPSQPASIKFYGVAEVYSESGVDLTLLRENLRRPVEQRLESNQRLVEFFDRIDRAKKGQGESLGSDGERPTLFGPAALLRRLTDDRVEFVLTGGLALILHGSACGTQDVGICYNRTPQNLAALASAFAAIRPYLRGAPPGLPFRFDVATIQAGLSFTVTTDLGDVD